MLQKHSFANLYITSYRFHRMCSWKTNFLLKWFANSHLGKRELERKVSAVVSFLCPVTQLDIKWWKVHFPITDVPHKMDSGRGGRSLHPCVPRNHVELLVQVSAKAISDWRRAVNSNQFTFFLQEPDALLKTVAANNTRQMFVPEDCVSTGAESKPVGVLCVQLLEWTTSFSFSPHGYNRGCRAW